ncbi:MAG: hypothetical protein SPI12_04460 [Actinomycetaceae bacterium]|nr:hypothetical protein [Actinomycetaceae bacterium]MDY6083097.1 hypothetical protein [Actinomycetaceae bacterium]
MNPDSTVAERSFVEPTPVASLALLVAAVVTPQVIVYAAGGANHVHEVVFSALVCCGAAVSMYVAIVWMARLAPRRSGHALVSTYIGRISTLIVACARVMEFTLLAVLGATVAALCCIRMFGIPTFRTGVLLVILLVLALPLLFGVSVPDRLVRVAVLVGFVGLVIVLVTALFSETTEPASSSNSVVLGIDRAKIVRLFFAGFFPSAVTLMFSEQSSASLHHRRVNPTRIGRALAVFGCVVILTLYFTVNMRGTSHPASLPILEVAHAQLGTSWYRLVLVMLAFSCCCLVLGIYDELPRMLRQLAMDDVLPRWFVSVDHKRWRRVTVLVIVLLSAALSAWISTPQAEVNALVFTVAIPVVLLSLALFGRSRTDRKESADHRVRRSASRAAYGFGAFTLVAAVFFLLFVVAYPRPSLIGAIGVGVPSVILLVFRSSSVHMFSQLQAQHVKQGRTLATRVHGVIVVSSLDAPTLRTVTFARSMRLSTLMALTVDYDERRTAQLKKDWARAALPVDLTVLGTPLRATRGHIVDYVHSLRVQHTSDIVVVYLPHLVREGVGSFFTLRRSSSKLVADLRMEPGVVIAEVPYVMGTDDEDFFE